MGAEEAPKMEIDLGFPDPNEFDSYDDVNSEDGQSELPEDSYDGSALTDDEPEEGCCVR